MSEFDVFIGLEIHVQLLTKSKMFCSCPAKFGEEPNSNVCPVCLGYPGALPVPNMQALRYAYRIAHALNCNLAQIMQFDRKNYYYPDLPKNYQITQFYHPAGVQGKFEFDFNNTHSSVAVTQAHLEEDAGKLIHTSDATLCDYNRSGTPLVEIVTEPELHNPEEAETLLKQFRRLVRYLGVCDGNMEEGSMRCDANISLNFSGKGLGSKVEIKNVNSFRFVRMALEFEIERQSKMLKSGEIIEQETRLWNENRDVTESMRTKEQADDYRYFPDPDIIPYKYPQSFFEELDINLVELPLARRLRFQKEFGLQGNALDFFTDEKQAADFFEATVLEGALAEQVAAWGISDVQKQLNKGNYDISNSPLTPQRFARMLVLLQEGVLHGKIAKQLMEKIFTDNDDVDVLIEKYALKTINATELSAAVTKVLENQQNAVSQYKEGDIKPFGFLIGKIMSETGGRADPQLLQKELQTQLTKQ